MTAKGVAIAVPWILTLLTAGIGIWKFTAEQQQANRKPFLEKQLEIGFAAADAVSRLATEEDPEEWEKARAAFWRLYWGPLRDCLRRGQARAGVNVDECLDDIAQHGTNVTNTHVRITKQAVG